MTIYRGVGGVNREVKQEFRGVGGINREIKEQYRCVGGVNRKVFNNTPANALYWLGDECTAKTGGWTKYSYHGCTLQKNADNMYFSDDAQMTQDSYSVLCPTNSFNFSAYSRICVDCEITNGNLSFDVKFQISTAKAANDFASGGGSPTNDSIQYIYDEPSSGTRKTLQIPFTSMGNVKNGYLTMATAYLSKIKIYKIWLE